MTTISSLVRITQGVSALAAAPPRLAAASAVAPAEPVTRYTRGSVQSLETVDYTDRIRKYGRRQVDALLAGGNRWFHTAGADGSIPSAVARRELTYSFIDSAAGLSSMDAAGFRALTSEQQDVISRALGRFEDVTGLKFTRVDSGGDLQFGSNQQTNSAGYARYPNEGSQIFLANNASTFDQEWDEGSYSWLTILHETSHALGLKHPGNYNAGGGGTPGPYLAGAEDHKVNTLMSYRNGPGMKRISYDDGQFRVQQVHADTLQAFDVKALQYLYGTPDAVAARTYSWDAGAAFSQTIWNSNGASRIDLSNQTLGSFVDLRAGRFSSIALRDAYADMPFTKEQYAALRSGDRSLVSILGKPSYTGQHNLKIAEGSHVDGATGGSAADTFVANLDDNTLDGGGGDDRFFLTGGNALVTGGEGFDSVFVRKVRGATWSLSEDRSTLTLANAGGTLRTVSLSGVENIRYWDGAAYKGRGTALWTAPASAPPAQA